MISSHGAWIIPYIICGLIIILISRRPIFYLWSNHRNPFRYILYGGLLFISGGLLLEILSYTSNMIDNIGEVYLLEVAVEELLEMLGVSTTLYGIFLLGIDIQSKKYFNN